MKNKEIEFKLRGAYYNQKYWFEGQKVSMEELFSIDKVWFETTTFGYNITEIYSKPNQKVYYFKKYSKNGKKYFRCLGSCNIINKPKHWDCKVNTVKQFLEQFGGNGRGIKNIVKYIKYFIDISNDNINKHQYCVFANRIPSDDRKVLINLGIIAKRTNYSDNRKNISKTYWYNPKVTELSYKIQSLLNCIVPIDNSIERLTYKPYKKLCELLRVINTYILINEECSIIRFKIRETDKYENGITGRPCMMYSNMVSKENHPDVALKYTRQGCYLEYYGYPVNEKSFKENYWHYDIVSSVPRVVYYLTNKEWLDESIDIYQLIAEELDWEFNKETRKTIKEKVLRANFYLKIQKDKETKTIHKVIGKNKKYSEIFLIEGFLYMLVFAELLLKQKYKLNWVFDAFEFYGDKHPSKKYMKNLVESCAEKYREILFKKDYTYIDELIERFKKTKNYKDADYSNFDEDNIKLINTLDSLSYHEIREINWDSVKVKLVELSKEMNLNYKDKYSAKTDKYSAKTDKYSAKTDKYSTKTDKYSLKEDIYSKGKDHYSIKFQRICDKIDKLLKNKDFIHKSEIKLSKQTWESLIHRQEFTDKFENYRGKITRK